MRIPLRIALALGLAGVLAACTDESTSTPTGPVVPRAIPSAKMALSLPSTCDATLLKGYARNYANKSNDQLLTLIGDLPTALKADGGTPGIASTDKAFDALYRIGFIRGTTAMKSDASKANFDLLIRGLLACTAPAVTAAAGEPPGGSFGAALQAGWVFEVRGKNTTGEESAGAYERGYTESWWGAWPNTGTWASVITSTLTDARTAPPTPPPTGNPLNKRVLIYGYRSNNSTVKGRLGSTFEHFSIPKIGTTAYGTFDVTATLGLCFADETKITGAAYVNHDTKFLKLDHAVTDDFCAPPADFNVGSVVAFGRFNPSYLARQAMRYVWPQPLYAATMFDGGGSVTGTPDDWSPSAVWDLSQFVLPPSPLPITDGKVSQQIHYGTNNTPVTFNVYIGSVGGSAAPDGTPVTVSVQGNQSVIAFFSDNNGPALPTVTRLVKNGVVSFDGVKLTKAGGYILEFRVSFDGFNGPATSSASFNIQNK